MVKNYFLDEVRFYNFIVNNHLSVLVFSQLCLLFFMQLVLSLFYKGSNHICLQGGGGSSHADIYLQAE